MALAAAIIVIIASTLGLPVSSTHIAVGGIFRVGLYREFLSNRKRQMVKPNTLGAENGLNPVREEFNDMLREHQAKFPRNQQSKNRCVANI